LRSSRRLTPIMREGTRAAAAQSRARLQYATALRELHRSVLSRCPNGTEPVALRVSCRIRG